MSQILTPVGDAINSFLSDSHVQLIGRAIAVYIVFVWLACAYWAFRDAQSRTANPIVPYLAAILIILFTPVLFPFGLLLYRLIRPSETVAEANERAIAEEAMLREIEAQPHCANCDRRVEAEWLVCPTCRNQLRRLCPSCSRRVELDWTVCAWCGTDLVPPRVAASRPPAAGRRGVRSPAPDTAIAGGTMEFRADQQPGPTTLP
ncbi:MAG: zinc ribbon domain-containing protein [Chloroflexi bacterium]|nr:zinc ribbon domain-containing protein [Chloroflexota bacterium]